MYLLEKTLALGNQLCEVGQTVPFLTASIPPVFPPVPHLQQGRQRASERLALGSKWTSLQHTRKCYQPERWIVIGRVCIPHISHFSETEAICSSLPNLFLLLFPETITEEVTIILLGVLEIKIFVASRYTVCNFNGF